MKHYKIQNILLIIALCTIQQVLHTAQQARPLDKLITLVKIGNVKKIEQLLRETDISINAQDTSGKTALMWAAWSGQPVVINELVRLGADLEIVDNVYMTALLLAAQNKQPEAIAALLQKGANIDHRDNLGLTALMHAAGVGDDTIIAQLAQSKADVNLQSYTETTALDIAAKNNHPQAVLALLRAGAQPNELFRKIAKSNPRIMKVFEEYNQKAIQKRVTEALQEEAPEMQKSAVNIAHIISEYAVTPMSHEKEQL